MKEYEIEPVGKCLQCGRKLGGGRTDRKFCSDGCKNTYNNGIRKLHILYKSRTDRMIERNYSILNDLVKLKIRQIPMQEADAMGFNPSFVTSHSKDGKLISYACYDIAFKISESRIFNIHRLELYLQNHTEKK